MNIIKQTRLDLGITQREVAQLAGMSPQAVMRYEQSLYENLSDKLAAAISTISGVTLEDIYKQYVIDRTQQQVSAWRYVAIPPPIHFTDSVHPFLNFRQGITTAAVGNRSRMSFCILLAVHPATVAEYDSGRVSAMPALIKRALINADISAEYLKTLCEMGEIWYERYGG